MKRRPKKRSPKRRSLPQNPKKKIYSCRKKRLKKYTRSVNFAVNRIKNFQIQIIWTFTYGKSVSFSLHVWSVHRLLRSLLTQIIYWRSVIKKICLRSAEGAKRRFLLPILSSIQRNWLALRPSHCKSLIDVLYATRTSILLRTGGKNIFWLMVAQITRDKYEYNILYK